MAGDYKGACFHCKPDAPVVMEVTEEEIQAVAEKIREQLDADDDEE